MSRSLIVAVGGTGQLVLHYYAQLFQIHAIPDPFQAIVVDSDDLLPSLQRLRDFWNVARVAHSQPERVPQIDYFPVARELGGTVQEALVGRDLPALPQIHPSETIFDSTSLAQGVSEGLYARPALSAVLQTEWSRFPLETLTGFEKILVVGSLIGGTGGGLIAPLLSELARRIRGAAAIEQPEIRAVFFGEYFELRADSPVPDASLRFPSNKLMVAYCLKHLAPRELVHFAFIEPAARRVRVVSDERSPVNLAWPPQNDPIWMGVSALEELRTNKAWSAEEEFQRKEKTSVPLCNLQTCTTTLNDRLALARTLDKKTVFKRLIHEPWLTTFYGTRLPAMLARATAAAKQKPALNISGPQSLASLVQEQYAAKWNDVASVFPLTPEKKVNPAVLRQTGWSDLNVNVPGFNASQQALTSSTAAHLLHSSLRGNEESRDPVSTVPFTGNQNRISNLLQEQTSWEAYTVFGESIPHLLHWDWAYLWIMSRQSLKPRAWETRIEAWRRLLCMLLLNELQLEAVPIEQPLLGYTRPVNLHEIVLVRWPGHFDNKAIAVLSPTVIIRPLPEPNRLGISASSLVAELPKHYDRLPGAVDRRAELAEMLALAYGRIAALGERPVQDGGSEFARNLLSVLQTNLRITTFGAVPQAYEAFELSNPVPLLVRADASAWRGMALTELILDVSSRGIRPQFVPKCQYADCKRSLTYAETDPPIEVTGAQIQLQCPVCRRLSTFELEDFALWKHNTAIYAWQELETFEGLGTTPLPPSPEIHGNEVWFRWNPARTGDAVRVHLRLRFPDLPVQRIRPADIKYSSLLVPGEFNDIKALPVRPEWLFALNQTPMPAPVVDRDVIVYRNVKLRGVKSPVTLGRYPMSACTIVPELQVGMFPKPMYAEWRRYRFFCSGVDLKPYRMCLMGNLATPDVAQRKPADIVETNEGLPQAIAVEIRDTMGAANTGATWLLDPPVQSAATPMVYAGVDFGTTNTVVYAQLTDADSYKANLGLGELAINRREILNTTSLIAGKGEPRKQFLPILSKQLSDETDITLIPSALWFSVPDAYNPIRWSTDKPSQMHQPLHEFKWKDNTEQLCPAYLEELLFLTLPTALHKLFPVGNAPRANWTVGFAFPLAFSDSQRGVYTRLFNSLPGKVSYTGGTVRIRNINESAACIKAFGTQNVGNIFLIADLGGGSLDVALFEIRAKAEGTNSLQVGSAKIGGEAFMTALSKKYGSDPQSREEQYWLIRDAIMAGGVASAFPGKAFSSLASKFLPIPQELLRVMVEAFRKQANGKNVKLVLVGNGWRVAEFTGDTPLPRSRGLADIEQTIQEFGIAELSLYKDKLVVPPKHIIAYGALKHARGDDRNELGDDTIVSESKMPAGRDMTAGSGPQSQSIGWSDLVGTSIRMLSSDIEEGHIIIHRPSGPPASPKWQKELDTAMPGLDHDPEDAKILENLGVSSNRIKKGPLQVILEKRAEDLS